MQEFIAAFQEMRTILTGEGSNLNLAPLNVLKRFAFIKFLSIALIVILEI
jgi:hypothetical protein